MRVVVALAVELGVVAVVSRGAVEATAAVAALVLAPAGYVVSYRRRSKPSLGVKIALSVGLVLALGQFIRTIEGVTTVDQARIPLASLFLWVQVLHAFDVPRRRDLAFSMVSSTTLIAAAGVLSLTTSFLVVLLVWSALAAAWLWLSARPRPDQVAAPVSIVRITEGRAGRFAAARSAAASGVAAVVLGSAVFMAMPRLPARMVHAQPFSLGHSAPTETTADTTVNPGLPSAGSDGVVDFAAGAYPGFSDAMDLRARGQLSDQIVFRVRAEQPALWRAEAFDTFDGQVWTESSTRQRDLTTSWDDQAQDVPSGPFDPPAGSGTRQLVQTFYLATNEPNVLFGAARMETVYFPAGGLKVDADGAVRAPILLDEGLVYSVISDINTASPSVLETIPMRPTKGIPALAPYLELPDDLPARDVALARSITAGASTPYGRALAIQSWLQRNTTYDLSVPREPNGVDAVDHFLFQTRRGFCEHIASAMVILLRASGVPARIATGYGPGERNPFTGYWEVRESDAHAWVEVLIPGAGWVQFDPTFGVPSAEPSWASRLVGPQLVAALGRAVAGAIPDSVKAAAGEAGRGLVAGARAGLAAWPVLLAVAALAAAGFAWRRRRRRASARGPTDDLDRVFDELIAAVAEAGIEPAESRTPSELLSAIRGDDAMPAGVSEGAALIVRTFELGRFARPERRPAAEDVSLARAAVARVRDLVGAR
jgi:protein-glutamine gamma-glutamyltransferase